MATKKLLLNVLMASLLCTGSMAYAGKYTADVAAAEAAYTADVAAAEAAYTADVAAAEAAEAAEAAYTEAVKAEKKAGVKAKIAAEKAAEKAKKAAEKAAEKAKKAAEKAKEAEEAVKNTALSLRQIKNKDIKARLAEGESFNSILTSSNDKLLAFNLIMLNVPKNKLLDLLTIVTRNFPTIAFQAISDVMSYAPQLTKQIMKNAQEEGLSLTALNEIKTHIKSMIKEDSAVGGILNLNGTYMITSNGGNGGFSCRLLASCS